MKYLESSRKRNVPVWWSGIHPCLGYAHPTPVCQIWDFCAKGLGRENFLKILKLANST